jgi:spoIIIJ-associated protein
MKSVEAEGATIDDAIGNALQTLGVSREQVAIDILTSPTKGVLGLGGRKAKVRVSVRPPVGAEPEPTPSAVPPAPQRAESPLDANLMERARTLLQGILDRMGFTVTVSAAEDDGMIVLSIDGDSSGMLIGRHGQTLDAFEYFLHRALSRDEGPTRIMVDCECYRVRRRDTLQAMAARLAQQAKMKRRPATIEGLSPRERRIVHLALQDEPGVTTRSTGDGFYRDLQIVPEGARGPRPPRSGNR